MLNCGADISYCNPLEGNIIIQYFLQSESDFDENILKRIIRRLGPSTTLELVNYKHYEQGTALYVASQQSQIPEIRLLLAAGAEIDAKGGLEGTALMVAARRGVLDVVRVLVDAGASIVVWDGNTWLSAVHAARYEPDIVQWFLVTRFTERRRLCSP